MKSKDLPKFEGCDPNPKRVGGGTGGGHGMVFLISEGVVAKTPPIGKQFSDPVFLEQLAREADIAEGLYERGISVPKPHGLFSLDFSYDGRTVENIPSFVMDFIDGIHYWELGGKFKERIEFLYSREIKKAISVDFVPDDVKESNSKFVPDQDRIYLIDFTLWKKNKNR